MLQSWNRFKTNLVPLQFKLFRLDFEWKNVFAFVFVFEAFLLLKEICELVFSVFLWPVAVKRRCLHSRCCTLNLKIYSLNPTEKADCNVITVIPISCLLWSDNISPIQNKYNCCSVNVILNMKSQSFNILFNLYK